MPDAVRDEIGEDLPDPDRVDVEDREVGRDFSRDGDPGRARTCLNERTTSSTSRSMSVGSLWSGRVPASRQGDGAQVIDESLHHLRFEDRGEVRLIGRVDAIDHRFEVAGDHAEGRPELVAHIIE